MTTANETRRHVMNMAWGLYRDAACAGDRLYTFAQALAGAWRFMKRLAASRPALPAFRSPVARSPIARRYGRAAFVGGRASATYLTARVGG